MKNEFITSIDGIVNHHRMLDHPFYQSWNAGTLSLAALREYAKQYYHFVQAFPTFVSATHANTPDLRVRQRLLENLIEEERGEGNHPGLWVKFADALGVSDGEARSTPLLPETNEAIATIRSITRDRSYLEGVAALYAYESQIPEVAAVKIDGLKKFYGVTEPGELAFFTVHQEADVHHSGDERILLEQGAVTPAQQAGCVEAARESAQAMLKLLDGVYNKYVRPSMN